MPELNANPVPTSVLLPKTTTDFFSIPRPIDLTAGDLDVRFIGRPQSWKPVSATGFACHGNTGDLSWRWLCSTNGFLQVYLSTDGSAETLYTSTVAIPNQSTINGVRFTRDVATGTLTFYTTRNEGTSWQALGATVATGAGALHLSAQDIKVGVAPPGTAAYRGTVRSFDLRIDTVSACNLDLTRAWKRANGPWVDTHGNEWVKNGDPAAWVVARLGMAPRPQHTDLANMRGWSADFAAAVAAGATPTAGTVTCGRIIVPEDCNVSKITAYILTAGSGITASQNWFALHNLDGSQVAVTAALSSADLTTGTKEFPLVSAVDLRAGVYVVKLLMNASTSTPTFAVTGTSAAVNGGGSSTYGWRFFTEDTGQTTIPTTPGAASRLDVGYLLGVA